MSEAAACAVRACRGTRLRSLRAALAATTALAAVSGCALAARTGLHAPDAAGFCGEAPVAPAALPGEGRFVWRLLVRRPAAPEESLRLVVEKAADELRVVALDDFGATRVSLRQQGDEIDVRRPPLRALPLDPRTLLRDLQRAQRALHERAGDAASRASSVARDEHGTSGTAPIVVRSPGCAHESLFVLLEAGPGA